MALYAYNRTGSPVTLAAGSPTVVLSPSMAPPQPGPAYNVTSKLTPDLSVDPTNGKASGLTLGNYAALQAQVSAGQVSYAWTSLPEYLTPGLYCASPIPLQIFSNTNRPLASAVDMGTMIFNSDDGAPNWSNGTNWIDSSGEET
jgi:hypothetical protein